MRKKRIISLIFTYSFLILIGIITLIPLLYTASGSFKTNAEIAAGGANLIPKTFTLDNYKQVWTVGTSGATFLTYTMNSIIISVFTVLGTVITTALSAYCFQRRRFPGRNFLYGVFLATMFVGAGSITIFPLVKICATLHIQNHVGIILIQIFGGSATNLFLTMGYMKTISPELDQAARIDGCSYFGIFWRIILPLSKPILATVSLMTFQASWNNYLLPNLMTTMKPKLQTLVVAIVKLKSSGGAGATQYNLMMAGTMFAVVPILVIYILMNRYFVEGMTAGAVKG